MSTLNDLDFLETLFTPLVSDTMDSLGIEGGVLPSAIQSVFFDPSLKVAGYAYPCQVKPTDEYIEINTLLEMVDSIPKDSIVLVASDVDIDAALWGGLMSTRAKIRGARGAVVTGGVRDIEQISALGFPVFGQYRSVKDIRRRGFMAEYGVTLTIGKTLIAPGDIIFGDANGVVCIPKERMAEIRIALEKRLTGEVKTQEGLLIGSSAMELFGEFGTF